MNSLVAQKVKQIIAQELKVPNERLIPSARFVADLKAGDIDCIELVLTIEKEFKIEIPEADCENLITVGNLIGYVEKHTKR